MTDDLEPEWRLVRDKVPEIMVAKGIVESVDDPMFRTFTPGSDIHRQLLWEKLDEELDEFLEHPCAEEIADVYEVLTGLLYAYGLDPSEVATVRGDKRNVRGGFLDGRAWAYNPDLQPTDTGYLNDPEVD